MHGEHPTPARMIKKLWAEVRIQNLSKIDGSIIYYTQNNFAFIIFIWDIPVCGEYKLVQLIVSHTQ